MDKGKYLNFNQEDYTLDEIIDKEYNNIPDEKDEEEENNVIIEGIEKSIVTHINYSKKDYVITSYLNNKNDNIIEVYMESAGKFVKPDNSDKITKIVLKLLKQVKEREDPREF